LPPETPEARESALASIKVKAKKAMMTQEDVKRLAA